jgi:hypothetical protein
MLLRANQSRRGKFPGRLERSVRPRGPSYSRAPQPASSWSAHLLREPTLCVCDSCADAMPAQHGPDLLRFYCKKSLIMVWRSMCGRACLRVARGCLDMPDVHRPCSHFQVICARLSKSGQSVALAALPAGHYVRMIAATEGLETHRAQTTNQQLGFTRQMQRRGTGWPPQPESPGSPAFLCPSITALRVRVCQIICFAPVGDLLRRYFWIEETCECRARDKQRTGCGLRLWNSKSFARGGGGEYAVVVNPPRLG